MKGDVGSTCLPTEDVQYPVAVQFGHHDVAQNEVRKFRLSFGCTDFAVFGRNSFVATKGQDLGEILADIRIVFDNKDSFSYHSKVKNLPHAYQ
jgi:hypothetical protein